MASSPQPPIPGPSVLLVEDDADIQETVGEALTEAGFQVAHAANGAAGIEYLRKHTAPRVILLDWNMPVMDAPAMVRAMSAEPRWSSIPIVLITSAREAKQKALEIRAAGYLKKPVAYDDLIRMMDASVGLRVSRDDRGKSGRQG